MNRRLTEHNFSMVPRADIQRSVFNRSHSVKTTFDSGYLVPFYVDEVLPGDSFTAKTSIFARLITPLTPFMDNLWLETFYFFVPNRLVWDHWQAFNGEQVNPDDSTDYVIPTMAAPDTTGYATGSLSDYFGIPTGIPLLEHSALYHRAYALIWNEWFRDENLQDSIPVSKGDGPDLPTDYTLMRRGKRHDYFTSCLPWPQKGPGVELPLGVSAPVIGNGTVIGLTDSLAPTSADLGGLYADGGNVAVRTGKYGTAVGNTLAVGNALTTTAGLGLTTDPEKSGMYADLSEATAATINSLREAFQIQRLLERDARGGSRYTEIIRSHFGVVSPDARLQRPEYLGGSSGRINIYPVAQTSSTDATTPQGNLAAFGVYSDTSHSFTKSFTEHGMIIGLVNVRADLTYQQGLPRMFSRSSRFDYYWPALAHLGEQAVLNKEIYAQGPAVLNSASEPVDDDVFGYQERYAEYRYYPSQITGKFRSTDPQSLDVWHLAQEFSALPALNSSFIEDTPPIERVVAVQDEPEFLLDAFMDLKCARPMPVYGVPGFVDHF